MKLITAIAALALVVGSFILVQPAWAKIQNLDDESWCVEAGFNVTHARSQVLNVNLFDCDDMRVNLDGTYPDDRCCRAPSEDYINLNNEGTPYLPIVEIDGPPFEWVYDTETQYIRSKRKPYMTKNLPQSNVDSEEQWGQARHYRCFGFGEQRPPWTLQGITRCRGMGTILQDSNPFIVTQIIPTQQRLSPLSGYMTQTPSSCV